VFVKFEENGLHLDLQADAPLPEIGSHSVESRVFVERHHASVELLDDVIEIDLSGFFWKEPVA